MNMQELTQYVEDHTNASILRIDTYRGYTIVKVSDTWRPYLLLASEFESSRPMTVRYRTIKAAKAGITRNEKSRR